MCRERSIYILETEKQSSRLAGGSIWAAIGSQITFKIDIPDYYFDKEQRGIHQDLLVVSAAIEFADRRWTKGIYFKARDFHIDIPVKELEAWTKQDVLDHLHATLRHLTGDEWHLTFRPWEGPEINIGNHRFPDGQERKEFVIPYSDGLDSLCIFRLFNKRNTAVPVRISRCQPRHRKDEPVFDTFRFHVKVKGGNESSARSRGFKFAAIAAIAAHLSKINRIVMPESGQGALGPVLAPSFGIYRDYRNHPTFFRRMEKFINALLDTKIRYEQPRLWHTKGQTVEDALTMPGVNDQQLTGTRSCWQWRYNVCFDKKRGQCGICAACLLRRMSLHAARCE